MELKFNIEQIIKGLIKEQSPDLMTQLIQLAQRNNQGDEWKQGKKQDSTFETPKVKGFYHSSILLPYPILEAKFGLKNELFNLEGNFGWSSKNFGVQFNSKLREIVQTEIPNFNFISNNTASGYILLGNKTPYLAFEQSEPENPRQTLDLFLGIKGAMPVTFSGPEDLREILNFYEMHSNKLVNAFLDTCVQERLIEKSPETIVYV